MQAVKKVLGLKSLGEIQVGSQEMVVMVTFNKDNSGELGAES